METTFLGVVDTFRPGLKLFEGTISQFDTLVCKSLDLMEQKIPNLYLPPTIMYWNTKEYMSDHLVRPVVKRAESFKELGNAVLDSPLDRLDHFVDAADKYVERYLPEGQEDEVDNGEYDLTRISRVAELHGAQCDLSVVGTNIPGWRERAVGARYRRSEFTRGIRKLLPAERVTEDTSANFRFVFVF